MGSERLLNLTQQLATMFQQSANNITTKTLAAANEAPIGRFLDNPSPDSRSNALETLQQFETSRDPNSILVELWNEDRSLLLTIPENSAPITNDLETEFKQCSSVPYKTVGSMRFIRDTIAYPAVAAVRTDGGQLKGYLVRWRRVAATPETKQQLMGLIGSKGEMYIGNSGGDVWSDLINVVPKPAAELGHQTEVRHYIRNGGTRMMALSRPISGTPWLVQLEFPEDVFTKQANVFLWRAITMGIVLLILAWASALVLSRTITNPLHLLTKAASSIAAGDRSRLVDIQTKDELGTLAVAFNEMVVTVRDSEGELERKVRERTSELEEVNEQLQHFSQSNALKRSEAEKE
ncbi:MAG TPA: HAMP domain-containing protein, partial [Pyrinomonadaceae bacterium]|nr:HAMP domain-containing protein [Pyrinomonadaceae bacterium]